MIIAKDEAPSDVVTILWTIDDGIKIKHHLQDALLPITDKTIEKIEERICDIK